MSFTKNIFFVASCMLALSTSALGNPETLLRQHNIYRCMHGAPALVWSEALAQSAQTWANNCRFEHSPSGVARGENLFMATAPFNAETAIKNWYGESRNYAFGSEPSLSTSRNFAQFTQMIWKGTTELGCGYATCSDSTMLVCHYSPRGNITGEFTRNVAPVSASFEACQ